MFYFKQNNKKKIKQFLFKIAVNYNKLLINRINFKNNSNNFITNFNSFKIILYAYYKIIINFSIIFKIILQILVIILTYLNLQRIKIVKQKIIKQIKINNKTIQNNIQMFLWKKILISMLKLKK